MAKKIIVSAIIVITLALVLFLPIPQGTYDDGGTRDYKALTYKIVVWNKIMVVVDENGQAIHGTYQNTSVFWFPDNLKSIDELWKIEKAKANFSTPQQSSANTNPINPSEDEVQSDGAVQLHSLYEKYPEYWDLDGMKGVEVYVWQTENGSYRCGALIGTNRMKSNEEIEALFGNGATIEEMKTIMELCEVSKGHISVIPVSNPLESDWYRIDIEEAVNYRAMFWGE